MDGQDFSTLLSGDPSLLTHVERIVVDAHRRLHESGGKAWSRPIAYHWLRYEDPMPVARLREGVRKLRRSGAEFDSNAVEKACKEAQKRGFLS